MQSTLKNPDSRPLPEGWAEHFDSERKIWYYVDVNIKPPRVTFVHPCDVDKHPASAPAKHRDYGAIARIPQRPVGPRTNASASLNAANVGQRVRRATVAQQLYASSLFPSGSRESPLASGRSSLRPAPSSSASDEVASSSNTPYTPKNSGVSSTSSPILTNLDTHHPRNFFDCTRLVPGTRRMTVNGPQPSRTPTSGAACQDSATYGVQALYPPSVNTTPSPIPPKGPPDSNVRQLTLAASSVQKSSAMRSNEPSGVYSNVFPHPPMNVVSTPRLKSNPTYLSDPKQYTAITDDNLMVMPQSVASLATSSSPAALDISSLQDEQPVASSSSRATDTVILQPKPIRPMKGISLNLQVQVAALPETSEKDESAHSNSKSKRKSQLLKNFGFGIRKEKAKMITEPYDGDTPNRVDGHASMDNSFVLVDTSM